MTWANRLFGNKNKINYNQDSNSKYGQPYNTINSPIESRNQGETTRRANREIICPYC